jgi:hypothetical protein
MKHIRNKDKNEKMGKLIANIIANLETDDPTFNMTDEDDNEEATSSFESHCFLCDQNHRTLMTKLDNIINILKDLIDHTPFQITMEEQAPIITNLE